MVNEQKLKFKKLEDLNRYITILIVDDDEFVRNSLLMALNQENYENVWAVENAQEAIKLLPKTNILLSDYKLDKSHLDGVELVRKAKADYPDRIEAIVFSGEGIENIRDAAREANAAAYLEKPVKMDYIKLWIKELGKRIWLQQILDTHPEEVVIIDQEGTILYADKQKQDIFGKDLIGDKCFKRFERHKKLDAMCDNCPNLKAFKDNQTIRTEWEYETRARAARHKVKQKTQNIELICAPLRDIQNRPLAIIEMGRDITMLTAYDTVINDMEEATDWKERIELFMDGFVKLGIPRARLYLWDQREDKNLFRLVAHRGEYPSHSPKIEFSPQKDKATQIMIDVKKPVIFRIDRKRKNRLHERDQTIKYLYWVGENNETDIELLGKTEWVDIPLLAGGKVIGKISADGWSRGRQTPDSYELELLARYGSSAGQIIQNARDRSVLQRRMDTEETILQISQEITNIEKREDLFKDAVNLACHAIGTQMCSIFLLNEDNQLLERRQIYVRTADDESTNDEDYQESYPKNFGLTRFFFDRAEKRYINDLEKYESAIVGNEPRVSHNALEHYKNILGEPIRSCIFAPLIVGKKKLGIIRAANKLQVNEYGERDFDKHDLEMFELLAGQVAVAFHNVNLQNDKENVLEDLLHTMQSRIQSLFNVADKFQRRKNLSQTQVEAFGEELEHLLNESKNQIQDFRFMIKAKIPNYYNFAEYDLAKLITEVTQGEKIRTKFHVNLNGVKEHIILADKRMLQHALHNLIHNAIEYSLNDRHAPAIICSQESEFIKIDVINYSREIKEDEREKIFDRYYRSEWTKSMHPGAGIGLHATKTIVENHKGKIVVLSEKYSDTLFKNTFSLFLPTKNQGVQNEETNTLD